jgi:hypothetical protein
VGYASKLIEQQRKASQGDTSEKLINDLGRMAFDYSKEVPAYWAAFLHIFTRPADPANFMLRPSISPASFSQAPELDRGGGCVIISAANYRTQTYVVRGPPLSKLYYFALVVPPEIR